MATSRKEGLPTLHVVVSCKSRKTLPVPAELRISSVAIEGLQPRVNHWVKVLESNPASSLPAGELYGGDHWKVIRNIHSSLDALNTRLWVVSAGYGLVEFTTKLKPYSATFIKSHEESVIPAGAAYSGADWWDALAKWRPEPGLPRRITEIADLAAPTGSFVLLALSEPYASALSYDIASASQLLGDRLGVISVGLVGAAHSTTWDGNLLPAEARLKNTSDLRGAMQGVNGRIAARAVREHALWFPSLRKLDSLMQEWLEAAPALTRYDSLRQSDIAVRAYIQQEFETRGRVSRSQLLRGFRDSGRACEQSRFAKLYGEVLETLDTQCESVVGGTRM